MTYVWAAETVDVQAEGARPAIIYCQLVSRGQVILTGSKDLHDFPPPGQQVWP